MNLFNLQGVGKIVFYGVVGVRSFGGSDVSIFGYLIYHKYIVTCHVTGLNMPFPGPM